jgi:hypothetical protein
MISKITTKRALSIAANWNQGEHSALYELATTGQYKVENHLRYLEEVIQEIHRPETALRPFHRTVKDHGELISLKLWIEKQGFMNNVQTVWKKDFYGIVPFPTVVTTHKNIVPIKRLQ